MMNNEKTGCLDFIQVVKAKIPWFVQFLRFGIIGAFNTLLALGIYELLVYLGLSPQLSNFIAFIISVANAYFWNLKWVFQTQNVDSKAILRFFALYGTTYLISAGLLLLWLDVLHINKFIAPVLSLFITIPTNFLFSRLWVFKSKG